MKKLYWCCLMTCLMFVYTTLTAQHVKNVRIETADEVEEGDGASVRRLIPKKRIKHFDPYVLFDDFTIAPSSGFPDHYHSGFEVITYVVQGKLKHKDSQGNEVVVNAGDIQCFTTGSGIVHSEMPEGAEPVKGFQIWINLPKEFKNISPGYAVVKAADIASTDVNENVKIKTITSAGAFVRTRAEILIQEIEISKAAKYHLVLPTGYKGFAYLVKGSASVEQRAMLSGQAVFIENEKLQVEATQQATLLLVSGLPLNEPIKRKGSIVK